MIRSVKIENFKSLESLDIPKFNQLTILGGKNNCGKTTVIEALFMLYDRMNPHVFLRQLNWRGVNLIPNEIDFMWAPFFASFDISKKITIQVMIENQERKLTIEHKHNYKSHIPAKKSLINGTLSVSTEDQTTSLNALNFKFHEHGRVIEDSFLIQEHTGFGLEVKHSKQGKREMVSFFGARIPSNQNEDAERLGRLEIENKKGSIIEIIQNIVKEVRDIKAIRIGDSSLIYVDTGTDRMIPISYMGDGISRLLTIALGIAASKNAVVLIDEIENGLHYSVMPDVWKGIAEAAKKFNCQVVCTTHSLECVSAANQALKDTEHDYGYIRLARKKDEVIGKYFGKEILNHAIESEMEIR